MSVGEILCGRRIGRPAFSHGRRRTRVTPLLLLTGLPSKAGEHLARLRVWLARHPMRPRPQHRYTEIQLARDLRLAHARCSPVFKLPHHLPLEVRREHAPPGWGRMTGSLPHADTSASKLYRGKLGVRHMGAGPTSHVRRREGVPKASPVRTQRQVGSGKPQKTWTGGNRGARPEPCISTIGTSKGFR